MITYAMRQIEEENLNITLCLNKSNLRIGVTRNYCYPPETGWYGVLRLKCYTQRSRAIFGESTRSVFHDNTFA